MDVHIPPRCLAGVHLYRVVVDWWGWMGLPAIFRSFPGPFFVSAPSFTGMGRKDEFLGPGRTKPAYEDLRIGFEVTMYFANR